MSGMIKGEVKRGRQIKTLQELEDASHLKESVITSFNCMMPATWVFSLQGRTICEYIRRGLYIYKGKKNDK